MTRESQKASERHYLACFLKLRRLVPVGIVEGEAPDFVIGSHGGLIGVEVTTYHEQLRNDVGQTGSQVEAMWRQLVEREAETRDDGDLPRLSVDLTFKGRKVPGRNERDEFIEAVREALRFCLASIGDEFTTIKIGEEGPPVLCAYIRAIVVRRCTAWLEWQWNHNFQHVGAAESDLLNTIGPKLRTKYRPGLAPLVLVVGGGDGLAQVLAPITAGQLSRYDSLNGELADGPLDDVALLGLRDFFWQRGRGWSDLF